MNFEKKKDAKVHEQFMKTCISSLNEHSREREKGTYFYKNKWRMRFGNATVHEKQMCARTFGVDNSNFLRIQLCIIFLGNRHGIRNVGSEMKIKLLDICHARSGDKGDAANVGLIAREERYYPIILSQVTRAAVKKHFKGICFGPVERFELPNLWALNFLLHNTLGGGGIGQSEAGRARENACRRAAENGDRSAPLNAATGEEQFHQNCNQIEAMRTIRGYESAFILIAALWIGGCSQTYTPPAAFVLPPGTYTYQLHATNLKWVDTTSAKYVLWVQMLGNSIWYSAVLDSANVVLDSPGYIALPHPPDSIASVTLSLEPSAVGTSPTSIVMTGVFNISDSSTTLRTTNTGGVGDFSQALATATFTTKSSNTNLADNEFYLLRFMNGVPEPSCTNLPIAPNRWSYGLWVLDTNFYPTHEFFYGAFTNSDSSDTNPMNADYPFPGGFNPAPLNDPGAQLEVTLEPSFVVAGNKPTSPSPLLILSGQLFTFLYFNDTLALQNTWSSSVPTGTVTVH